MNTEKKMDLDEPVNVDMEPEDALRLLLGNEQNVDPTPEEQDESSTD